tara:strand:+ start:32 stop:442 length:411 start_codon:yes stop_codon:yes gene_type:complete
MKKTLFIIFLFISCANQNNGIKEIGNLSILEYPDIKELNRWIESDSQYANVYQVRRYFENFVNDEFFEEEENQSRFNDITWLYMSEYQKKYAELLNKYENNFKEYKELTSFVDSLISIEYPIIIEFTNEVFRLEYN